jgi:hypothetical protein
MIFYDKLNEYLKEGFALAKRSTGTTKAIGFVMSIFQKIAASSFAAVKRTLQNRFIALAIFEAVLAEEQRDIVKHDDALKAAKEMLRKRDHLSDSTLNNAILDKYVNDIRVKHLKSRATGPESLLDDEQVAGALEGDIATLATAALPGERKMIEELLGFFPLVMESKVQELNKLLAVLWRENENEKIVIFATYLGTVEMLKNSIEAVFNGKRVEIYKGGDHSAKIAAEKRFRALDGPQVMLCTAAGREGINLQYARVLINFDLPWNPMDIEQRIGRIHRYGQKSTSQVYNFVSTDTIEGAIYQTLEDKIVDIAATLGKVDENGEVAEDLRSQILGQLATQVSYDQLYRDALNDPLLVRTKEELQVAVTNAKSARSVVFELFQDLDRFDLSEYKGLAEASRDLPVRLLSCFREGISLFGGAVESISEECFEVSYPPLAIVKSKMTVQREVANADSKIGLVGFDHPIVLHMMKALDSRGTNARAVAVRSKDEGFLLTVWRVSLFGERGTVQRRIVRMALSNSGHRIPEKEHLDLMKGLGPVHMADTVLSPWLTVLDSVPSVLERDLKYRGLLTGDRSYQSELIGALIGV